MIRALLYNQQTKELKDLDAEQVIASMPGNGAKMPEQDSGKLKPEGENPEAPPEKLPLEKPPEVPEGQGTFAKLKSHCHRGELMWIDIEDPTEDDYGLLTRRFALHPLVIEDMKAREGRPKLHDYSDYLYIIFHALAVGEKTDDESDVEIDGKGGDRFILDITEIDCLVGPDYMVTIHPGKIKPFHDLYSRWKRTPALMDSGAPHLLYELMDEVLDEYFPILDALDERIDAFEDRLFMEWQENLSADIFALKRCLLQIRRIAGPTRDVVNILLRHDADAGGKHFAYFQDLYDHASRIVDSVDTFRDLLSGALDAYLAIASNRMNEIMKTLTSASIILLIPTLIAGIYGMNFENMPELHSRYGYFYTLGAMAVIIISLTIYFRRKEWL